MVLLILSSRNSAALKFSCLCELHGRTDVPSLYAMPYFSKPTSLHLLSSPQKPVINEKLVHIYRGSHASPHSPYFLSVVGEFQTDQGAGPDVSTHRAAPSIKHTTHFMYTYVHIQTPVAVSYRQPLAFHVRFSSIWRVLESIKVCMAKPSLILLLAAFIRLCHGGTSNHILHFHCALQITATNINTDETKPLVKESTNLSTARMVTELCSQ